MTPFWPLGAASTPAGDKRAHLARPHEQRCVWRQPGTGIAVEDVNGELETVAELVAVARRVTFAASAVRACSADEAARRADRHLDEDRLAIGQRPRPAPAVEARSVHAATGAARTALRPPNAGVPAGVDVK